MAAAQPAEAKQLRLFATLDGKQQAADGSAGGGGGKPAAPAVGAVTNPQQRLELLAAGSSSKWSPFYAVSARHDMHTTALLTHCISLGHQSSGQLAGFDRDLSRCGGCEAGSQDGQLAAALAEQLVPGWRALTRTPGWRWHLQNLMESPCFGVPGICRYTAARAAWLAGQLRQGIEEDACRQVVVLRSGLSTWSHAMSQPGVQFYEVDSRQACQRKRELLDEVAPGWRRAARRPRFVEVDFSGGLKTLITELTGAGFDPSLRCCIVAEGLLAYLSQDQADSLITDLSALCAPGSRLLFDFLHADALEGGSGELPGFASLAEAAANKGCPLRSGMRPAFSAMVKLFQPHRFRVMQVLPPHQVAAFWRQQQQTQQQQKQQMQQQPGPGAGGKRAAAALGANGKQPPVEAAATAAGPASGGALPYVPEFFGFVAAVKIDSRLLLRRAVSGSCPAAGDAAASGLAGGVSGWVAAGAAAAMSSPSCIVRSLAFLLWGGARLHAPQAARAAASDAAAAPLLPPAAPERQPSAEFTIAAAPSQPQAASALPEGGTGVPRTPSPPLASGIAVPPAGEQQPGGAGLDRALSILPRGRIPGSAVRGSSDSGHLMATGSSSGEAYSGSNDGGSSSRGRSPSVGSGGAAVAPLLLPAAGAQEAEEAWPLQSVFSFSNFF